MASTRFSVNLNKLALLRNARGTDRIELNTHGFAAAYGTPEESAVTAAYRDTALAAQRAGLGVNAGHDLSLRNLEYPRRQVPGVLEVSIGHAFVCECLDFGMEGVLSRYLGIIERCAAP
jgi:pyridoxine 5-phosphate synthase